MMPVRWLTKRSRTRWSACRSSCSALLVVTNFIVGRWTASAIASASRKSVLSLRGRGARTSPASAVRHDQWGPELATEVMRTDAGLHADQARRHIGKPCFNLAPRPLLTQYDCTAFIQTDEVERVLADINADCGNRSAEIFETWRAPCLWCPLPASIAGGAGARPDHSISGHRHRDRHLSR